MGSATLIVLFIVGIVMVGMGMIINKILSPSSENAQKAETYECGVPTQGSSWLQFKVGYYLFAIMFLIFDVETVFLVPWSVVMKKMVAMNMGGLAFTEISIFFFILGIGLLYAWKKNALKWQ